MEFMEFSLILRFLIYFELIFASGMRQGLFFFFLIPPHPLPCM